MEDRTCNSCGQLKPLQKFRKIVKRGKTYYAHTCEKCFRERRLDKAREAALRWAHNHREEVTNYARKWWRARPEEARKRTAHESRLRVRERNFNYLREFLSKHPCTMCGVTDIEVLEFDHLDPKEKEYNISHLTGATYSLEKIQKEIKKCQVLCANCHRKKTFKERGGALRSGGVAGL